MKFPKIFIHSILIFFISICWKQSIASDAEHLNLDISNAGTLKALFVVLRHGARAPVTYDGHPFNETAWPNGPGELTERGKWQMQQIGQFLRRNYSHFLSKSVDEVELRSAYLSRLIESAESVWQGFTSADDACLRTKVVPIRVDQVSLIIVYC